MRVVICGGGVIGASIAYFLSCLGVRPIVVESTGVACAASGKSAAFWRWIGAMVRRLSNWHVAALSCTLNWLRILVATWATAEWSPIPAQLLNTTGRDVPQSAHPDGWRKVSLWIVAWGRQTPPHRFIPPNLPLP